MKNYYLKYHLEMPVVYMHEGKACNTRFLHAAAPYVQAWTMVLQSSHFIREGQSFLSGEIPSPQSL